MTHLSPATARALKAAGFNFRNPIVGDRCARLSDDCLFLVTGVRIGEPGYWMQGDNAEACLLQEVFDARFLLLPTVEDLLEPLPYGCSVSKSVLGFQVKHQYHEQDFELYSGPTLAEALATAYLALNQTPAP